MSTSIVPLAQITKQGSLFVLLLDILNYLNDQWITEEIDEEIRKYLDTDEDENIMIQTPWNTAKISSKRKVYSKTGLPREIRKISNKQPNLTPKGTRKQRTNKTKSS